MLPKPDSLIFDMDGTLWDATDTYTKAWNIAYKKLGLEGSMSRERLNYYMGWEKKKLFADIFPDKPEEEREHIAAFLDDILDDVVPKEGGKLYDGVVDGLKALSEKYKLFIVSNCPKNTIKQMIGFAGIGSYITDEFAHGVNSMPKNHNIRLLIEKHGLKTPVYVGDTEGDKLQSELTPLPFIFVSYGFGKAEGILNFDSFVDFSAYFLSL